MAGYPYADSWCLELDYPLNVENIREALGLPRSQPSEHVVVVPKRNPILRKRNPILRAIDAAHYWNLFSKKLLLRWRERAAAVQYWNQISKWLLLRWRQRVVAWLRVYGSRAMALLPPVPDDGDP